MPGAIGPIIAGIKATYAAYQGAAIALGATIGLSSGASTWVANAALQLALGTAINAAFRPQLPDPEGGKFNIRQPRPLRRYGVGRCRVSAASMMQESQKDILHHVLAFPEGPVGHFGRKWLNDDEVTLVGGVVQPVADRYTGGLAKVEERRGLMPETAYSNLVAEYGSVWTPLHRGDGIPSMWLRCANGDLSSFSKRYPGGPPVLTTEAFYLAYDWRKDSTAGGAGSQRRNDPTTWAETSNSVVWTVNVLWRRYRQDWDRRFAPTLDLLTEEANVCDQNVALKAGGLVKRYEVGLWFEAMTPVKTVLTSMLASMDGWFGIRRDGAFIIRAGRYVAPTVIFGEEEIIDWSFNPGPTPDGVVNVLKCAFTDPASGYTSVDVEPWINAASVATHGEKTADFAPQGVQNQSQNRRLAKAALDRALAPDGTFKTPLSARRGLGERFVGVRLPPEECEDLTDAVVEILNVEMDFSEPCMIWTYKLVTEGRYTWNAEAEEGEAPANAVRPAPVVDAPPVITSITPFYESLGGATGVRLHLIGTGPDRGDLSWFYRWRVTGSTSWSVNEITDTNPASNFEGDTGFVGANPSIDVALGYRTGGGNFVWSATTATGSETPSDFAQTALDAWLDRISVQPGPTLRARLFTMIHAIGPAIWAKLDRLGVLAVHDASAALVDLKDPTKTIVATSAPVFAAYKGFTGDGVDDKFALNYNPGAGGMQFVRDAHAFGVWALTDPGVSKPIIGTNLNCITAKDGSSQVGTRSASATEDLRTVPNGLGLLSVCRTSSANYGLLQNGASVTTITRSSSALASSDWSLLTRTGLATYTTAQIAVWYAGSLTRSEITTLHAALYDYLHAVGAV